MCRYLEVQAVFWYNYLEYGVLGRKGLIPKGEALCQTQQDDITREEDTENQTAVRNSSRPSGQLFLSSPFWA